ncbi:glycosyltransferase family 4 protein [Pikeienuella sp. HZG-20]|uniref:glycosyltransferase family 4 protein n=1 Tax=Paludibacillus litoralis TaxID=3133267 RepID=UPI0030EB5970
MTAPAHRRIAFYAPMKAPDHPNPSGDRRVARLLMRALDRAGWETKLASRLRTHQSVGNPVAQDMLFQEAERVADKLLNDYAAGAPPAIWFTYHCYYKAPDLIGPTVARALSIPYVVAEGYRARKRLDGPYARFAHASERALDQARLIFHLQARGLDALERDRPEGQKLIPLPPFTALGAEPAARAPNEGRLNLLTVAMMRPGDKLASYRALASALSALTLDWRLTVIGDGAARPEVEAAFAALRPRVVFRGQINDRDALRSAYETADLFLWPGVNEAFGMAYLEAQSAGVACVAEDRIGVRDVIGPSGRLTAPGDPAAFAAAIAALAEDRGALAAAGRAARAHVKARHGVSAAAARLNVALEALS